MASYKQTLITFIIFVVIVVIGTTVFAAIENRSYQDGFAVSIQIITTVGYGNVPPETTSGKVFCIFYTLIGIPINLVLLQKVGEHMMNVHKFIISKFETKILKRAEAKNLGLKSLAICSMGIIGMIMLGAFIQVYSEGWSFLDGVYCYVITFTTVGFGDLIPGFKTNKTSVKVVMPLFTLLGLCVMATTINCVIDCSLHTAIASIFTKKSTITNSEDGNTHDVELK